MAGALGDSATTLERLRQGSQAWDRVRRSVHANIRDRPPPTGRRASDTTPAVQAAAESTSQSQAKTIEKLKQAMSDLCSENSRLHGQMTADKLEFSTVLTKLRQTERVIDEQQGVARDLRQAKELMAAQIQRHNLDREKALEQRRALGTAVEGLRAKMLAMEQTWRARETALLAEIERAHGNCREAIGRLADANRELKSRFSSGHYREQCAQAQEQVMLLKKRLRAEQLKSARAELNAPDPSADPNESTSAKDSVEVLSIRRDNVRMTSKVRALEDRIAEKDERIAGLSLQVREMQALLQKTFEGQTESAAEAKRVSAQVAEVHKEVEARIADSEQIKGELSRAHATIREQEEVLREARERITSEEVAKRHLVDELDSCQCKLKENEVRHETVVRIQRALVEIAQERDALKLTCETLTSDASAREQKMQIGESVRAELAKQVEKLTDRLVGLDESFKRQTRWYENWSQEVKAISAELQERTNQLNQLNERETIRSEQLESRLNKSSEELMKCRSKLLQSEKSLEYALLKNAQLDSTLQRVITIAV